MPPKAGNLVISNRSVYRAVKNLLDLLILPQKRPALAAGQVMAPKQHQKRPDPACIKHL